MSHAFVSRCTLLDMRHPKFLVMTMMLFGAALSTDCGDSTSSGGGGAGGGCDIPECFAPVECVEQCGGPIVQSGCCPCDSGLTDVLDCGAGGAGGGG